MGYHLTKMKMESLLMMEESYKKSNFVEGINYGIYLVYFFKFMLFICVFL